MNLNYSEEQIMLREQVQRFCDADYDFYKREAVIKSENDFDLKAWNLFAEQGWLSIPFSEESGGFGFGPIELSVLFEEFGKALVIEPYLSTVVLSGTLLDNSNYAHKLDVIEKICNGSMQVSLAYAEAANSYNYSSPMTSLSDDMKLNGTKTIVLNGGNADKVIISCMHKGDLALVIVNASDDGISMNTFPTVDGQACAEITFENVIIAEDSLVGLGNEAETLLNTAINLATLCVSAEAVGCMSSCYLKTVEYTKGREQFDQPISNFQVLQHRMVDMFIESELCKSLLIKAMVEVDCKSDEMFKHVSALKAQVGKSGKFCAQQAVQLHGGMGVSDELMIGHYLKKLIVIDALFGNTDHHLKQYSK